MDRPRIVSVARCFRSIVLPGVLGALLLAKAVSMSLGSDFLADVWSVRLVLGIGMSGVALELLLPPR